MAYLSPSCRTLSIIMGSSESKVAVASTPKPDPCQRMRHNRVAQLIDPRSPSVEINRTPIQVGGAVSLETGCPVLATDPRSPSVDITRTPMKDSMRATVGSFARRLGMLLNSDYVEIAGPASSLKCPNLDVEDEAVVVGELGSSQPLLSPQPSQVSDVTLSPPTLPSPQKVSEEMCLTQSPFLLLGETQVEVEADHSVEEAEEAKESPLHKQLSMSLITCHNAPYQIYAEVHQDSPVSPVPDDGAPADLCKEEPDHSYAVPSEPAQPLPPTPKSSGLAVTEVTEDPSAPQAPPKEKAEVMEPVALATQDSPVKPLSAGSSPCAGPPLPQTTGIRCPKFDTKSPSQVVFKPQWLGKGFGVTGVRAKGRGGRGPASSSSPLAVRVGTKNIGNENPGQSVKPKQRGKAVLAEGRSPLQILKETNSPRDQTTQMKLKVSTPDRKRLGQMDRRVLTISVDKENR
uniref:Uncharacterized protein n=2 Tax=Esox lucius TaxID=8010 RepID=A0A6Q2YGF0_ESOLU